MKIEGVPFRVVDWSTVPESEAPGLSGTVRQRRLEEGNLRVRLVTYSPGYRADHWCSRGHVLFVLEGTLQTEVQGGATHVLTAGMSYQVSDDLAPHRSSTETGARLLVVD